MSKIVCNTCGSDSVVPFKEALDGCPICCSLSIEIYKEDTCGYCANSCGNEHCPVINS